VRITSSRLNHTLFVDRLLPKWVPFMGLSDRHAVSCCWHRKPATCRNALVASGVPAAFRITIARGRASITTIEPALAAAVALLEHKG
jgi:hypothetical protein